VSSIAFERDAGGGGARSIAGQWSRSIQDIRREIFSLLSVSSRALNSCWNFQH